MAKNIEIIYDTQEKELTATVYDQKEKINWSFNLYQNTDEMVEAGKALRNSLACQRGLAVEKKATFLYVKNEYDQIVGCISLKRQNGRFIVWEFECVSDFEPKHRKVALQWLNDNGIDYDGRFDLRKVRGNTYGKLIGVAV